MIEVQNLVKNFGPIEVIKNISFSIGPGEILGFLGPNGAGKTTVMRILAGFYNPDSGIVKINGITVNEDPLQYKNYTGYLPENVPLYADMTVYEFLLFIAEIRLIPGKENAVSQTMELCGIADRKNQRIETLSRGYRQRIGLAQAIIHDPPVLILDEPMTGLDPGQINEMRILLKELGTRKTVIFSTHILSEAESVCSRFLILNQGRIAAQGPMEHDKTGLETIFTDLGGAENDQA